MGQGWRIERQLTELSDGYYREVAAGPELVRLLRAAADIGVLAERLADAGIDYATLRPEWRLPEPDGRV